MLVQHCASLGPARAPTRAPPDRLQRGQRANTRAAGTTRRAGKRDEMLRFFFGVPGPHQRRNGARSRDLGVLASGALQAVLGVQQRGGGEREAEQQPLDSVVVAADSGCVPVRAYCSLKERDGKRGRHCKGQAAQAFVTGPDAGDGVAEHRRLGSGLLWLAVVVVNHARPLFPDPPIRFPDHCAVPATLITVLCLQRESGECVTRTL